MKRLMILTLIMLLAIPATMALAETYDAPNGTVITATVNGNIATITVTGYQPTGLERYYRRGIDKSAGFQIDLSKGRRFQVMKCDEYLLITPGDAAGGAPFKLVGIGVDCSNPNGCCLIVK
jgi:hypothetical protein